MELPPAWLLESWVEYGVAILIILVRIFARTRPEGLNGWHGDDYLILIATGCFTGLLYSLQALEKLNRLSSSSDASTSGNLDDLELKREESRDGFIGWAMYISTIWSLKACILFYFSRMEMSLIHRRFLKFCGWLVFLTYIGVWICGLLKCLPGQDSTKQEASAIPGFCPPGEENFYVVGISNLVTTALIFIIPIPLLWQAHLTIPRLICIGAMSSLGLFTIGASALRNVLSLIELYSPDGSSQGYVLVWTVREILAATIVVCVPCIKALFTSFSWLDKHSETPIEFSPSPTPPKHKRSFSLFSRSSDTYDPEKAMRNSTSDLSLSCKGKRDSRLNRRSTLCSLDSFGLNNASMSAPQLDINFGNGNGTIGSITPPSGSATRSTSRSRSRPRSQSNRSIIPFNLKVNAYTSEHPLPSQQQQEDEAFRSNCSSRTEITAEPRASYETTAHIGIATTTSITELEKEAPLTLVITKKTEVNVVEDSPNGGNNLNGVTIDGASKKRTSDGIRRSWGWRCPQHEQDSVSSTFNLGFCVIKYKN